MASTYGSKWRSYGGVLFDDAGRVLLRKPTNEFDGYVWTFAKGRLDGNSTPEETALREVREETGYTATILGAVPGEYPGGSSVTFYYIMSPDGAPQPFDSAETEEIRWSEYEEAVELIGQTRNVVGRQRDLAVLQAAYAEYRR